MNGAYSDASLRYHFSIMSCDPASPIAKVEKGQGYYRRTAPVPALTGAQELLALSQGRLDDLSADHEAVDLALERLRKFRAVVMRYFEVNGRFPYVFRQAFAQGAPLGNLWKFPEVVLVDWETGDAPDEVFALDPTMLSLKQRLGLPPFRLHAARLRIHPQLWIAIGLLAAGAAGVAAWFAERSFLTALPLDLELPLLGSIHLSSVLLFDLGVYLVVFGATVLMLIALAHQSLRSPRRTAAPLVDDESGQGQSVI